MLDPETRRAILARVEAALDRMDSGEAPPDGIAAAFLDDETPEPDLYALLAQMTALTREVQLQGRAANRLSSEVTQLVQQVADNTVGQVTAGAAAARRDAQTELFGELLDVRERVARGRDEARNVWPASADSSSASAAVRWSRPSCAVTSWRWSGSTRSCAAMVFTRSSAMARPSIPTPCVRSKATSAVTSGRASSPTWCGAAIKPPSASCDTPR
jgi:hypothetical protein